RDRTVTGVQTCALPIYPGSIVHTRQIEGHVPTFERIFQMVPPNKIINAIEEHFDTCHEAEVKILTDRPLTKRDRLALSRLDRIRSEELRVGKERGSCVW